MSAGGVEAHLVIIIIIISIIIMVISPLVTAPVVPRIAVMARLMTRPRLVLPVSAVIVVVTHPLMGHAAIPWQHSSINTIIFC